MLPADFARVAVCGFPRRAPTVCVALLSSVILSEPHPWQSLPSPTEKCYMYLTNEQSFDNKTTVTVKGWYGFRLF